MAKAKNQHKRIVLDMPGPAAKSEANPACQEMKRKPNMKRHFLCVWAAFVWIALLASCTTATPVEMMSTPTERTESTQVPSQTPTIPPTGTRTMTVLPDTPTPQVSPTATEIPLPSPTSSPAPLGTLQCLSITDNLPASSKAFGSIVLQNRNNETDEVFIKNIASGDQKYLLKQKYEIDRFYPSPDGRWLAGYNGSGKGKLVLFNYKGERVNELEIEAGWGLDRWVDNHRIVFHYYDFDDPRIKKFYVVDPFLGKWHELDPPDGQVYVIDTYSFDRMASYDPSLSYVVYSENSYRAVLENLNTNEIITQFNTHPGTAPSWAPDGQSFVILAYFREPRDDPALIQVDLSGKIKKIIQPPENSTIARLSYYWSSDGKYIATWSTPEMDQSDVRKALIGSLVVLNVETNEIKNFCIETQIYYFSESKIYWSPDSRFMLFNSVIVNEQKEISWRTIIVDIIDGWAAQIDDSVYLYGWLAAEP